MFSITFMVVVSFLVSRRCSLFPIPSRKFAPRCKESDGSHSALRVAVRCNAPTERSGYSRGNYFGASEATIFSKRGSPRSGSQTGNSFKAP